MAKDNVHLYLMLVDRLEAPGVEIPNDEKTFCVLAVVTVAGVLLDIDMLVMDRRSRLKELHMQYTLTAWGSLCRSGSNSAKLVQAEEFGAWVITKKLIDRLLLAKNASVSLPNVG